MNTYSQTFITAVKKQICARIPLSFEHGEPKEEKSTERMNALQQTTTEIQSTPTDSVPQSSNFLSTPEDYHELHTFINPNKQHPHFNSQRLNETPRKQCKSIEQQSQNESVYELQTDLSASVSSPPTSFLSTVKKKKQLKIAKRQIGVCHQLSPSDLRSARIALYSIMQQLFLPEFKYRKGSTIPEDSTSNLPVESCGKRIKKNSHLLSLSPFFDEDNNVIRVGGRLANSPYSVDKNIPHNNSKNISTSRVTHPRKSFEKPSQWTPDDPFCPPTNSLDSRRNRQC